MKLRWELVLGFLLACLFAVPSAVFAGDVQGVGSFTRVQNAKVRAMSASDFANATKGQAVNVRDTVRTGRRSYAEITFADQSMLRVNEYTDLVIQQSDFLRKMQLEKGTVWMRVTKGSGTSIQTPVATATVRGTEFSFDSLGNLWVFEGTVWLEAGGETLEVNAGEGAEIGPDGKPRKKKSPIFKFEPGANFGNMDAGNDPGRNQGVPDQPWWNPDGWHNHDDKIEYAALLVPFLMVGSGDPPQHTQGVPEPGTLLVIGCGFIALMAQRKRRIAA